MAKKLTECGVSMPMGPAPSSNPRLCARPDGHDGPHRSEGQVDGPYRGQVEDLPDSEEAF